MFCYELFHSIYVQTYVDVITVVTGFSLFVHSVSNSYDIHKIQLSSNGCWLHSRRPLVLSPFFKLIFNSVVILIIIYIIYPLLIIRPKGGFISMAVSCSADSLKFSKFKNPLNNRILQACRLYRHKDSCLVQI